MAQDWVTHLVLGRINPGDVVYKDHHSGQEAVFVRVARMPNWDESDWDEGEIVIRWSSGSEAAGRPSVFNCWITEPPR